MTPWLVAGWAGLAWLAFQWVQPLGGTDWGYFWVAGHTLISGQNPYHAVEGMAYPLFYPGPAVVVLAPFGLLPERAGWLLFTLVSGFAYGWAAQVYGNGLLPAVLSACFLEAVGHGQWTPLLVAGAVLPALGFLLCCKPSLGLGLFLWRPHRWIVGGSAALTLFSFLVMPTWPWDWLRALQDTNHVAPVARPWGWLLLLAALKWRTPEGRLMLGLALVPQTTNLNGALPLFLLCRNRWEGYLLAGLSFAVAFGQHLVAPLGPETVAVELAARWPVIFAGLWLPALGLVLLAERGATRTGSGDRGLSQSTQPIALG